MNDGSPHWSPSSSSSMKTITLVRHGVAAHNVPDVLTGARPDHMDPRLTDPPLVRRGEMQARALGEQLRRRGMIGRRGDSLSGDISSISVAGPGGGGGADAPPDGDVGVHENGTIELVVCSPLTRCLQTASLVFPSYFADSNPSPAESCGSSASEGENELLVLDRSCSLFCHGDLREAYGIHYPDKRG
jgi:phosphohistidine phosphatase SixA